MSWFELAQLLMAAVPSIIAVIGGILVVHSSYRDLVSKVTKAITILAKVEPLVDLYFEQAAKITKLTSLYAEMQISIDKMMKDIETIRKVQQDDAFNRPQKGKLPKLETDDTPEEE